MKRMSAPLGEIRRDGRGEADMKRISRIGAVVAAMCLAALASYFAHVAVGTRAYDGYDWLSQAISDLTADDAPGASLARTLTKRPQSGTFRVEKPFP